MLKLEIVKLEIFKLTDSRSNGPVTPATPLEAMVLRSEMTVSFGEESYLYANHEYSWEEAVSSSVSPREIAYLLIDLIASNIRESMRDAVRSKGVDSEISKS